MLQVERELSITLKCDGEEVTAIVTDAETGESTEITEAFVPDERNPVWRDRVSDEIYSWIELMADEAERTED